MLLFLKLLQHLLLALLCGDLNHIESKAAVMAIASAASIALQPLNALSTRVHPPNAPDAQIPFVFLDAAFEVGLDLQDFYNGINKLGVVWESHLLQPVLG